MHFYIEKENDKHLEIFLNANEWTEKTFEPVHIATIVLHQPGYLPKIEDTILRRWNLLFENRMQETEEINKRNGEVSHYLVAKK